MASKTFAYAWRLSLLLLPWQTRWFRDAGTINGIAWEAGRLSIYVSWLPLLAMMIIWLSQDRNLLSRFKQATGRRLSFWLALACLGISVMTTISMRASFQWCLQQLLLAGFIASLVFFEIPFISIARWFVASLIPAALFGIIQFIAQTVTAATWLGMAGQNPHTPGVSVIEAFGHRLLRAYGIFPHPNIFAAWMTFAILALGWLIVSEQRLWLRLGWSALLAIFMAAWFLAFSRSAWLGLGAGIVMTVRWLFRSQKIEQRATKTAVAGVVAICLLVLLTMGLMTSSILLTRLNPSQHLEAFSLHSRIISLKHGLQLFRRHPWFGTGPGTALLALKQAGLLERNGVAEPPHNVLLIALDEFGLFGVISLIYLYARVVFALVASKTSLGWMCIMLSPFLFFDHFLWSIWSGQALFAVGLIFTVAIDRERCGSSNGRVLTIQHETWHCMGRAD